MSRVLDLLRLFFARDTAIAPMGDHLLRGNLNPASRNELFYAELIESKWDEKYRDYPWPPGWQG